jgi:hypothetical protein
MGFVVGKVALGQVFSEYFGFSCQSSFHQLLHKKWPQYKGLSPTPLAIKKTYYRIIVPKPSNIPLASCLIVLYI